MNVHHVKCWPEFFEPIFAGLKTFEIRLNDRDYQVDDLLVLQEWTPHFHAYGCPHHGVLHIRSDEQCVCGARGKLTGRTFYAGITYITDFAQKEVVGHFEFYEQ